MNTTGDRYTSPINRWLRRLGQFVGEWRRATPDVGADQIEIFGLKRWEWIGIGLLVAVSCAIHLFFRIRGFGEADEARFANYVLAWRESGQFPEDTYTNRTSPLYLIYLRLAVALGLAPLSLPAHMNYVNVFSGSLALVPMFLLTRRLARDSWTAVFVVVMYWFVPAFWFGNNYGMPHIPALGLMLGSLVFLVNALTKSGRGFQKNVLFAFLLMAGATGLKSDIMLCGLAFPGVVLCLGPITRRNLLTSLQIPVLCVATVLIMSRVFLPVSTPEAQFAKAWSQQFPFSMKALLDERHLAITTTALGSVLWAAAGVAVIVCLFTRNWRLVPLALVWVVPTTLFWGMIYGNAARHLTVALYPIPLLIVVAVRTLVRSKYLTATAVVALIVLNYYSAKAVDHPHFATPRLFESHALMVKLTQRVMKSSRDFAAHDAARKLLLGVWVVPHCEFAVLARAERFKRKVIKPEVHWEIEAWQEGRPEPTFVRVRRGRQDVPERRDKRGSWLIWNAEGGRPL